MVGAVRFELTTSCTRNKRASQATLRPEPRQGNCPRSAGNATTKFEAPRVRDARDSAAPGPGRRHPGQRHAPSPDARRHGRRLHPRPRPPGPLRDRHGTVVDTASTPDRIRRVECSGAFVYRLGHGPLKAERRVRFPYALPNNRRRAEAGFPASDQPA